jgi:hypothetical protein
MPRPINKNVRYESPSEPCRVCGGTLRYIRNDYCVECVKRANAEKHQHRKELGISASKKHYVQARHMPLERIAEALAQDRDSVSAIERGRYLDSLLRKKFKLDGEEAKPAACHGDLHRATLPVGSQFVRAEARDDDQAANTALYNAIRDLYVRLPDIVSLNEVIGQLASELVARMGARLAVQTARALKSCRAVSREIGQASHHTVRNVYILRHHEKYAAMKRETLTKTYRAQNQARAAAARSLTLVGREAALRTSRKWNAYPRASKGDCGHRASRISGAQVRDFTKKKRAEPRTRNLLKRKAS